MYNFVFERVPHSIACLLLKHTVFPARNFIWTILLDNKIHVKSRIYKDRAHSFYEVIAYKTHDPVINKIETKLVDYFSDTFPHNSVFIDCGSNIGLRSLTALSKGLKVYMIEPNPDVNVYCEERCVLNNFSNYKILPFGVSNTDSKKSFFIDSSSWLSTLNAEIVAGDDFVVSKEIEIEVFKLDTLFRDLIGSKNHIYIKIDIEGHENEAIEGAQELIHSLSPTFLIEIINKDEDYISELFNKMLLNGYTIFEKVDSIITGKLLRPLPKNREDFVYESNDFLFIKNPEIIEIFRPFTLAS